MRKLLRFVSRALPFLVSFAVILALVFFPGEKGEAVAEKIVVRVWNVDTFEGGKGSRTSFLRRAAKLAEGEGVYYLIESVTAEGASAAQDPPDMISFGVGMSSYAERALPLPRSFAGGMLGKECRAYPWCRGEYRLFSLTDNFGEEGKTAISAGGSNLCSVAARLGGVEGEELDSVAAYTGFLDGKFRYLLGTQRDVCRFAVRGAEVFSRPLPAYNDLYQYISILSASKREECLRFLDVLLSEKVQGALGEIGMLPAEGGTGKTVCVFTDPAALGNLRELALLPDGAKNIGNFLKTI